MHRMLTLVLLAALSCGALSAAPFGAGGATPDFL